MSFNPKTKLILTLFVTVLIAGLSLVFWSTPVNAQAAFSVTLDIAENGFKWQQSLAGPAPLNNIDLRAFTTGTVADTSFTFYCNRSDSGTNITSGWDAQIGAIFATRQSVFDVCNYPTVGTFTAKVIAERGGVAVEDRATITVQTSPTLPPDPTIPPPTGSAPTVDLDAQPKSINEGDSTVLIWSSTNATNCQASGAWSGSKPTSGTRTVRPTELSLYTIICSNSFGSAVDNVNVFVRTEQLPTLEFDATPSTLPLGQSAVLSWTTAHADTCRASGGWSGIKVIVGNETISPNQNTTYVLRCTNSKGSVSLSRTIFIGAAISAPVVVTPPPPPPAPIPAPVVVPPVVTPPVAVSIPPAPPEVIVAEKKTETLVTATALSSNFGLVLLWLLLIVFNLILVAILTYLVRIIAVYFLQAPREGLLEV